MAITLRLLGPFSCRVGDTELPALRSRRGYLLLALLVLQRGRSLSRDVLMDSLWPESDTKSGQENLRRTLTDLRHALGTESSRIVSEGHQAIRFELDDSVQVDILRFDTLVSQWEKQQDIRTATEATSLYNGPLLQGFDAEWLPAERNTREEQCQTLLEFLARRALDEGIPARAVTLARRAERLDPLKSSTQRLLYEALVTSDDLLTAERAFREFRERLHREMRQEPEAELLAFVGNLRQTGKVPVLVTTVSTAKSSSVLPFFLTSFVGRQDEITMIAARLAEPNVRLLTLLGIGGLGKTRLAVEVGRRMESATFVDLSSLPNEADENAIFAAILTALGEKPQSEASLRHSVATRLTTSRLLILDNVEHLVPVIGQMVVALLTDSPACQVLTTSRRLISVPGEMVWPVGPHDDAIALFGERARAALPEFVLSDTTRKQVADLCERLDYLPLALELAAARLRVLTLDKITDRLDNRFALLAGNVNLVPERHRTLRGALEWSYALLTDEEKSLFAALSVFTGGATLEAIEAVAASLTTRPLDILASLVDSSLVIPGERFRMLETVREFAAECLRAKGEAEAILQAHFTYFLTLAQEAGANIWGASPGVYLERLEAEQENFQTAILRASGREGLRLCLVLGNFWMKRSHYRMAITLTTSALEKCTTGEGEEKPLVIASGRSLLGRFQRAVGDAQEAEKAILEAIRLCREVGERIQLIDSLNALGGLYHAQGRLAEARANYQEGLLLCEETGENGRAAILKREMGILYRLEGKYEAARAQFEAALEIFRAIGGRWDEMVCRWWAGFACEAQSDFTTAIAYFHSALALARELGSPTMELTVLQSLADVARDQGEFESAGAQYEATLSLAREVGDWYKQAVAWRGMSESSRGLGKPEVAYEYCQTALGLAVRSRATLLIALELLSEAAAVLKPMGRINDAVSLYAFVESTLAGQGVAIPAASQTRHAQDTESLRATLGETRFAEQWQKGIQMTSEEAFALAQSSL